MFYKSSFMVRFVVERLLPLTKKIFRKLIEAAPEVGLRIDEM